MTAAILGADVARRALAELGDFDEIVIFEPPSTSSSVSSPSSPTRGSTTCSANCRSCRCRTRASTA